MKKPSTQNAVKRVGQLIDASLELQRPTRELLTQVRALVLCNLPYKRHASPSVTRTAKTAQDLVQVTFATRSPDVGLPFGADRAVLCWIQTRALQAQSRFLFFDTLTDYYDTFRISKQGVSYPRFHQRLERLLRFNLAIDVTTKTGKQITDFQAFPIVRSYHPKSPGEARKVLEEEADKQGQLISGRYGLELSQDFWDLLKSTGVPTPLPVLRLFHDKPLGWDLTQFLLWRCYGAKNPALIPWDDFKRQFPSAYSRDRDFRRNIDRFLDQIRTVYPDFPVVLSVDGFQIQPWRAPEPAEHRRLATGT